MCIAFKIGFSGLFFLFVCLFLFFFFFLRFFTHLQNFFFKFQKKKKKKKKRKKKIVPWAAEKKWVKNAIKTENLHFALAFFQTKKKMHFASPFFTFLLRQTCFFFFLA